MSAAPTALASRTTPPLPTPLSADLELRLDQRQAVVSGGGAGQDGRQDLRQRDERDVDHDQLGSVRKLVRTQLRALRRSINGHPRILAQPPVELAVGDVERDHVHGAALEQTVGEATGRGADIERPATGHVEPNASSACRA